MTQTKLLRWLVCGLAIYSHPGIAPADGRHEAIVATIGEYQASLYFSEPVKVGKNPFLVQIKNGMAKPVKGARVEISSMPIDDMQQQQESGGHQMSGKHRMSHGISVMATAPTTASTNDMSGRPGDYAGVINFSVAGQWMLMSHFIINGQGLDANFAVDVTASHSSSLAILAGFAGLNALIIWAASVTRRRPGSA